MPRRSNHTPRANEVENKAEESRIRVERESFVQQCHRLLSDPRTRTISGILLLTVALFFALAYVSFLFTGTADMSILSSGECIDARSSIRNILGLPGAWVGNFLINESFGILSASIIIVIALYGLRLLGTQKIRPWAVFFHAAFWLLWGSITFGFAQQMVHMGTFKWGGAFGKWAAAGIYSYIQFIGTLLVLLVTLTIFLIVIDPRFVEHCEALWTRFKALFHRKPKPESTEEATDITPQEEEAPVLISESDNTESDSTETIDLSDIVVQGEETPASANDDITLTIENADCPPSEESGVIAADEDNITPVAEDIDTPTTDGTDLTIEETKPLEILDMTPEQRLAALGPYDPRKDLEFYKFPGLELLKVYDNENAPIINEEEQRANGARIVTTLRNYGIEIDSIKATVGPTVTLYEIVPKAGIRISKIQSLESDIMLSLSATGIRIIAPMPGKGTVGIEVPNEKPQTVSMHSVIASKRFQEEKKMRLPIAMGRTITNEVFLFDLAKTPHLLVAGATGQGKSVAINAIITSLLYKKHPAEMKMVLVDPKMVEFAPYKPLLKHYLAAMPDVDPEQVVITECDKVVNTLNSLVIEMENRYKLLMDAGVRNLEDYNDKFIARRLNPAKVVGDSLHHQFLPYIVIVIDEYGDFIMQAGKQVETPIARITQKARAVGMHMILATQRPSVNIVTGVIKANIPTRIALRTQSVIDSRTVLDAKGAEQLIGRGDMLYAGNGNLTRIQCAFVDTPEVDAIVEYIAKQQHYLDPYPLPEYIPEGQEADSLAPGSVDMKKLDPMFGDVARYVVSKQEGSTSRLQRAFEIGYNRAGKLSDQLEAAGIVGPNKGSKGRDVLIQDLDALESLLQSLSAS